MPTATKAPVYYCTLYATWPAPEVGNWNAYKGETTPTCWQEFPTAEDRDAHAKLAHPEQYDDRTEPWTPPVDRKPMASVKVAHDPEPRQPSLPLGKPVDNKPSPEQLDLIERLGKQKQQDTREVRTRSEASTEIERLMAFPDKGFKPNRFPGSCTECHQRVAAEEGFVRNVDGAWLTAHKPGECPEAKEVVSVENGRYAVRSEEGHLSFYKVTNGRKPGVVFVDLLLGGGAAGGFEQRKVPFQNVDAVLAKIAADPEGAARTFGQETGVCCACGRGLTNEASRKMGIGPECASK